MNSISELLEEAAKASGKTKSEGVTKVASSNVVLTFANELLMAGNNEHPEKVQEVLKQYEVTDDQRLIEKVAEAAIILEGFTNIALNALRGELLKEASSTGKTEEEIDSAIEKIAVKVKSQSPRSAMKLLLGLLGAGTLGTAAGYHVGKKQGMKAGELHAPAVQVENYGMPAQ